MSDIKDNQLIVLTDDQKKIILDNYDKLIFYRDNEGILRLSGDYPDEFWVNLHDTLPKAKDSLTKLGLKPRKE